MLDGIGTVILFAVLVVGIPAWIHGILTSDGQCDTGADCENCPFPCENHERKRREKK